MQNVGSMLCLSGLPKISTMSKHLFLNVTFLSSALASKKLRRVDANRWKMEADTDERGLKKVQEIESFRGQFKDY